MALRRAIAWPEGGLYVLVQIGGCCAGAVLAHAMFELPLFQTSTHARTGAAQWLAEKVRSRCSQAVERDRAGETRARFPRLRFGTGSVGRG
ncbi:MAG: hypothetical protein ACREMA_20455, partial [Longimicrobiales bacterium]